MVRSEALGNLFRLNPPVYGVYLANDDNARIDISRTYANLWAQDKRFLVDAEIIDDRASFNVFLLSAMRLGIGYSSRRFAETQTDQTAISFHDLFRLEQDGRLEAGKNHTAFKIPDYDLEFSKADLNRPISEQVHLDLSFLILPASTLGIDLGGTLFGSYEFARGTPYFTGAEDKGFQLNLRYPWNYGSAYAAMTHLVFDDHKSVAVATASQQSALALGVVEMLRPDHEVLAQIMIAQPVFRQLGQMSKNSYEIQLGYRFRWERIFIEAALIENIFWLYNSPDWGLSLGFRSYL